MAEYANAHFETYVKEADLKQQKLMENPVPDNLDQLKKFGDFIRDILKDKRKQKDLGMDGTFEKIQSKNACVMSALSKLWMLVEKALIWIILGHILRKQCSCWARPVITSHILEGITFGRPQLSSATVQRNVEGGGRFVPAALQKFVWKKV